MASDGSSSVRVAPREIADATARLARVHGCDAADAERVGADATFCEVEHGGGLAAVVELAAAGRLPGAVAAARLLERRALEAAERGVASGVWDEPVPYALLARSAAAWGARGIDVHCGGAPQRGTDVVGRIELRGTAGAVAPMRSPRAAEALAAGVTVDAELWARVEHAARRFLTSAAALDAAAGESTDRPIDRPIDRSIDRPIEGTS